MGVYIVHIEFGSNKWYIARINNSEKGKKTLINNFYTLPQDLEQNSEVSITTTNHQGLSYHKDELFQENK